MATQDTNTAQYSFDTMPANVERALSMLAELSIKFDAHHAANNPTIAIDESKPMSKEEAAEYLNLKPSTIYQLVCKRELPHYKQCGKLYFFRADLLEYVRKGKVKTVEEINEEESTKDLRKRA